jgi:hypothetical protein
LKNRSVPISLTNRNFGRFEIVIALLDSLLLTSKASDRERSGGEGYLLILLANSFTPIPGPSPVNRGREQNAVGSLLFASGWIR